MADAPPLSRRDIPNSEAAEYPAGTDRTGRQENPARRPTG